MGKKLMLRCIALLLVLATLSVLVISCGSKDDTTTDNTQTNNGNNQILDDPEKAGKYDHIPETNMDGYTFEALARVTEWFANEVTAEPDTGDQVLQSIYDRNTFVETRYNCILTQTLISESEWTTWQNSVKAGESIYKVGLNHMMQTATEALNGTMLNLKELPKIKFDGNWWNQSMNKELTLNNKLYFTANEYCTSSVYFTWLMIFNMDLCSEKGIDVYGMIEDGTWTIDKLYEIVSGAYGYSNGDKAVDVNDTFGLVTHYNTVLTNYLFAFEIPVTTLKADGKSVDVAFNSAETRMIPATEKIYDLLFNSADGTLYLTDDVISANWNMLHDNAIATKFSTNTALFANVRILGLETLRTADVKYGIVPFPKWDTEQTEYHSHVDGRASLLFVPYTLPESEYENVGTILEALAISTKDIIMPVIQAAALLGRYSEDSDAYQCLQMTMEGRSYAFAYVFNSALKTTQPYWSIVNIMKSKSNNFTNYWGSKTRTAAREINTVISKYINLHEGK